MSNVFISSDLFSDQVSPGLTLGSTSFVDRERRDRAWPVLDWGFEGQFRGRDLKRLWMRCMLCLFVYLELQLECVIDLVIPSVMLYPYRCSWMRSTFVHHSYLSKVYPLYAINASC